jgi:hypothetical protein
MKCDVEMGSDAMIYIYYFHEDRFIHPKIDRGVTQAHRQHRDRISLV